MGKIKVNIVGVGSRRTSFMLTTAMLTIADDSDVTKVCFNVRPTGNSDSSLRVSDYDKCTVYGDMNWTRLNGSYGNKRTGERIATIRRVLELSSKHGLNHTVLECETILSKLNDASI